MPRIQLQMPIVAKLLAKLLRSMKKHSGDELIAYNAFRKISAGIFDAIAVKLSEI